MSKLPPYFRHPGEGRDLAIALDCHDEIPAFAGMTIVAGG
jgi:hypothetical protein